MKKIIEGELITKDSLPVEYESFMLMLDTPTVDMFFKKEGMFLPVIKHIRTMCESYVPDIKTKAGRDYLKKYAADMAKYRIAIKKAGDDVARHAKIETNNIDRVRRNTINELLEIEDALKAPLTKYEADEKERVTKITDRIEYIRTLKLKIESEFGDKDFDEILSRISKAVAGLQKDTFDYKEYTSESTSSKFETIKELTTYATVINSKKEEWIRIEKERIQKIKDEAVADEREKSERDRLKLELDIANTKLEAERAKAELASKVEADAKKQHERETSQKNKEVYCSDKANISKALRAAHDSLTELGFDAKIAKQFIDAVYAKKVINIKFNVG